MSAPAGKLDIVVSDVITVNSMVKRFHFKRADGHDLPAFSAGAHIVVEMRDDGQTRLNPYSLMSSPLDTGSYAISVRRDDNGRGGSLFMHERVKPGMSMVIGYPVNLFSLDLRARKHLLLAGGIGITPFIAQMAQLFAVNAQFELHYSCRNAALASYADTLSQRYGNRIKLYLDDADQRIHVEELLRGQPPGTHLYICGPAGMIEAVKNTASALGWPAEAVHYEHFAAPLPGQPFEVTLASSGKRIRVGERQSLLEALEAANINPPCLCRGGVCGQCETNVISHDGVLLHNDHWLSEADHASGKKIMPCVSRLQGSHMVLDR